MSVVHKVSEVAAKINRSEINLSYFAFKMTFVQFVHDCAVDVAATLCDVMAADEHYLHTSSQVGPSHSRTQCFISTLHR